MGSARVSGKVQTFDPPFYAKAPSKSHGVGTIWAGILACPIFAAFSSIYWWTMALLAKTRYSEMESNLQLRVSS